MGLRHDLMAWAAGQPRPRYGDELRFAGTELPEPETVRLPTRQGPLKALRYPGDPGVGRLLHLHGGAFVMRHPLMDDFWARFVVATTGLEVVVPDYAVAPRARYPVAHEQAVDAARALEGPLVVSGFSAGGNLAAAVVRHVPVRGQLLVVPSLDVAEDVAVKSARAPGAMITPRLLTMVRETYFRDAGRRGDPDASPLRAPSVSGVPPAYIVTAERDVLRAEGEAYAERLRAAGVAVDHETAPGADHYVLNGLGGTRARDLMTRMATWLRTRVVTDLN